MDPYWMYRVKKGEVESKLFETKKEPKGWFDSPKAAKADKQPTNVVENDADLLMADILEEGTLEITETVSDDDSTGYNQLSSEDGGDTGSRPDA